MTHLVIAPIFANIRCRELLETGSWKNFKWKYQPVELDQQFDDIRTLIRRRKTTDTLWTYSGKFSNDFCEYRDYTPKIIQECFDNNNVLFLGDSRTRVLYNALIARIFGRESVFDRKIHFEEKTPYQNEKSQVLSISYIHTRKFQTFEFNIKKHSSLNFKTHLQNSNFIVIGEQFLHPITREVKNNKKSIRQSPRDVIDKGLQIFQDSIIPQISKYKNPLAKVLILSAEGRLNFTHYSLEYSHWTDSNWEAETVHYNKRMAQIIRNSGIKNVNFMSVNKLTVKSPDNDDLTVDFIHKLKWAVKGHLMPVSLKADTDVLLNYFCNDESTDQNTCHC